MCAFYIERIGNDKARVRCKTHAGYPGNQRYCPSFDKKKYICPVGGDIIGNQELLEKEGYGVLLNA